MTTNTNQPRALVTGASSGIGAAFARHTNWILRALFKGQDGFVAKTVKS